MEGLEGAMAISPIDGLDCLSKSENQVMPPTANFQEPDPDCALDFVPNVARKARLANTIVGYTPYGAAVYADNHVVLPNGYSYYPNNVGQTIACNGGACTINGAGPNNTGYAYGGYDSR